MGLNVRHALAAIPHEISIGCPGTPVPEAPSDLMRVKGDSEVWAFVIKPEPGVTIDHQVWTYRGKNGGEPEWGSFSGGDGTNGLNWASPNITDHFTINVKAKRHCAGSGEGPDDFELAWSGDVVSVIIKRDGVDITEPQNNPQEVKVGEMINLTAEVKNAPDGSQVSGNWSIPGTILESWTATQSQTTKIDADTSVGEILFYWVDIGHDRQVSYVVTVNEVTLPAVKVNFDVTAPNVTGRVDLSPSATIYNDGNGDLLSFGNPAILDQSGNILVKKHPGFTLYNVTTSDSQGQIDFVQVVNQTVRRKLIDDGTPDGKWIQLSPTTGGDLYPWSPITSAPDPNSAIGTDLGLHTEDSPGQYLVGNAGNALKELTIEDTFVMWIMYKPNTPNAAWVPLMSVSWGWSGSAKQVGGQWVTGSIPFGLIGPIVTKPNFDYPQWSNYIGANISWN